MLLSQPADTCARSARAFVEALDAASGTACRHVAAPTARIMIADGKPDDAWQTGAEASGTHSSSCCGAVRYLPRSAKLGEALFRDRLATTLKASPDDD